ncbi:hypothetical protein HBI62_042590 [Parastagonospora nodorum]|nr:hypothetical protein HBH52_248130 [Parastagonospora nodorum]KAH4959146.1 hypothetical protein HBI78_174180 [Parastagonospora nodorum]KAH5071288.1 hypothetical protein HBH96_003550 [Parastagonospora nodorum]KAH5215549.1 hypothetical protein HBH77_061440 [Parastagonospora nodorum]KAH5233489.1 hypothetical protein HBI62_042590 [Parastagonospora nodorum]
MVVAADAIILPSSTRPFPGCRGYPVKLDFDSHDENAFSSKSLSRKDYKSCVIAKCYGKCEFAITGVLPSTIYLPSFGDGDSRNRNVASSDEGPLSSDIARSLCLFVLCAEAVLATHGCSAFHQDMAKGNLYRLHVTRSDSLSVACTATRNKLKIALSSVSLGVIEQFGEQCIFWELHDAATQLACVFSSAQPAVVAELTCRPGESTKVQRWTRCVRTIGLAIPRELMRHRSPGGLSLFDFRNLTVFVARK